jgi:uncharacterized protein DUF1320
MPTILSIATLPTTVTADVGYKVLDSTGVELIARTNDGVVQTFLGEDYATYQAEIDTTAYVGNVVWDDDAGNAVQDRFNVDTSGVAEHTTVLVGRGRGGQAAVKASGEQFDLTVDWADALAEFAVDESIATSAWAVTGSITINGTGAAVGGLPAASHDDTTATVWCKSGTEGTLSEIKNTITTSGGRTLEEIIRVTVIDRINQAATGVYCSLADVQNIFGRYNVETWAKIEDVDTGDVDARIVAFIADAEDYIDARLRSTRYTVPFVAPIPRLVKRIAATLAGVYLYEARGALDVDPDTGRVNHRYTAHKKWAEDKLEMIRKGGLQLEALPDVTRHPVVVDAEDNEWVDPYYRIQ